MQNSIQTFEKLYDHACVTADWRPVEELYTQINQILNDSDTNIPQRLILGHLSERLERVSATYSGQEADFVRNSLSILSHASQTTINNETEAFRHHYLDTRFDRLSAYASVTSRRRPKPFEAIVETARRRRDLASIRHVMTEKGCISAILGGSLSYGRFFNVKGNAANIKASDLDLLLVVQKWECLDHLDILKSVEGIHVKSVDLAIQRVKQFKDLYCDLVHAHGDPVAISFSHKFVMWRDLQDPILQFAREEVSPEYEFSLHIVDLSTFNDIILDKMPIFKAESLGNLHNPIFDYRPEEPKSQHTQRSFDGLERIPEMEIEQVAGGFLTHREACFIENHRYFPGFHQNLILPAFDIAWEDNDHPLYAQLRAFRWKLVERLRHEKARWPFRILRLSLSHTRSIDFAPQVIRRVDDA